MTDLDLDKVLEKLSLGSRSKVYVSTELPIYSKKRQILDRNVRTLIPTFTDHNEIGALQINGDKSYSFTDVSHSTLIPESMYPRLIGMPLTTGFRSATFIDLDDPMKFSEQKQEYFLKWLIEHNYFQNVLTKKYKKPDFICFGRRITDSLMSPEFVRFSDWEIHAVKFQDSIYLWNDASGEQPDLQSYTGIYFEHLLTKLDPFASLPNEYEKTFVIHETTFGSHQILAMTEIDALDLNGELVEIKNSCQCPPHVMRWKYLKYWGQCVVPGIQRLIIGERNKHKPYRLRNITAATLDEIVVGGNIDTLACLDFEDRFLSWVKSCFGGANDENTVKLFSRRLGDSRAKVEDVPLDKIPKLMLPKWFVEQMKESEVEMKCDEMTQVRGLF